MNILENIDALKSEIDALQPISADQHNRIMQKLRLDWNYHSVIEENKLSYEKDNIKARGEFKNHLDIKGHDEAIDFLLLIIKDIRPILETDIRDLHRKTLKESYKKKVKSPSGFSTLITIQLGKYKNEPNHVKTVTGEMRYYATPEETPSKMEDLMIWLEQILVKNEKHPLKIASIFHHRFVSIHPFDDGNGRMSRLLMNYILMRYNYPPVVIKTENKIEYYAALHRADNGELLPFIEFIGERLKHSLTIYLKGAKGENIDEPNDIDKEIALLKGSISNIK